MTASVPAEGPYRCSLASSDADIGCCWPVMAQLRPHITQQEWLPRIRRQMQGGYRLSLARAADAVVAVGGFRAGENLAWGRYLYIDDLVTDASARSRGAGRTLLGWLADLARAEGCVALHLDSGVQRFAAHRFYLTQRMNITSHHFGLDLTGTG
jgi:GNAT superfamily N-acetyltransferase